MTRLPLTVVSGYLGAGKTTLINRLLAEDHGQKLMVMVNDFGAINIDAALLQSADEDTMVLSNGCVCCTMGADLFLAIGDVLDRSPRPDHLVIEASGIADPTRIAAVAQTEPDLIYAGIVTVVDVAGWDTLRTDPQIGPQIIQQATAADVVFLSKTEHEQTPMALEGPGSVASQIVLAQIDQIAPAILGQPQRDLAQKPKSPHAQYLSWHCESQTFMTRDAILQRLKSRPTHLLRFKGFVAEDPDTTWEVQCVGPTFSVKRNAQPRATQIVGIGLADRITKSEISDWWDCKD